MASAACALLFAALHMNPWQFAGAFGLGLLFGWWLLRTNCLWLCLFGHAVANGSLVISGWLPWSIPGLTLGADGSIPTGLQPWWLDLTGLALLGLGLWLFHRLAPPLPPEPSAPPVIAAGVPPVLPERE